MVFYLQSSYVVLFKIFLIGTMFRIYQELLMASTQKYFLTLESFKSVLPLLEMLYFSIEQPLYVKEFLDKKSYERWHSHKKNKSQRIHFQIIFHDQFLLGWFLHLSHFELFSKSFEKLQRIHPFVLRKESMWI